jgi:hypothetical protein
MLNHEYQLAKREKLKDKQMAKIAKKASEARVSLLKVLKQNAECEKEMLEIPNNPNPNSKGVMFGNITLKHLEKTKSCMIAHLQSFIHVRMWNGLKPKGAANWSKKRGRLTMGSNHTSHGPMN